ncbi:hypothetical protein GCM10022403_066800 [Streptomyces coacervatus]|uniref:Uncharacterized protein n=1 Tax=Streptomyces coacervatus TaxID=647381 RepID=A0ABP7IPX3_9ACTN|nr:hypothetical protein [Streptomyces coacervatus]MDF2266894.1 hypothetical protein [Streptomyces coacervatus]
MFFKDKHCPTCPGSGTQVFRPLNTEERKAVKPEHRQLTDLWRCTAVDCRWYQRWSKQSDGGQLPEDLKNPGAAPE